SDNQHLSEDKRASDSCHRKKQNQPWQRPPLLKGELVQQPAAQVK
ncbi:uncharacterized, partial [Lates japonicus]